jgi:hypothetical protein
MVAAKRWLMGDTHKDGRRKGGNATDDSVSMKQLTTRYRIGNTTLSQARDLLEEATDLAEEQAWAA